MDNKLASLKEKFIKKINSVNNDNNMTNEQKMIKINKITERYKNIQKLVTTQPEVNLFNPFLFNMMQNNATRYGSSYYHSMSVSSSYTGDDNVTHITHKKYVNNNGHRDKKNIKYSIDQNGNKIMN